MADAGDALPLHGGGGGEQRAGAAEEEVLPFPLPHPVEQVAGEDGGGAAAARAAAVDVLRLGVEDEAATVVVVGQIHAVLLEEVQDDLSAQAAQIAGDDQIIKRRRAAGVGEVGGQALVGRRSHGGAHVVGVTDALVHNLTTVAWVT